MKPCRPGANTAAVRTGFVGDGVARILPEGGGPVPAGTDEPTTTSTDEPTSSGDTGDPYPDEASAAPDGWAAGQLDLPVDRLGPMEIVLLVLLAVGSLAYALALGRAWVLRRRRSADHAGVAEDVSV